MSATRPLTHESESVFGLFGKRGVDLQGVIVASTLGVVRKTTSNTRHDPIDGNAQVLDTQRWTFTKHVIVVA